MSCTEGVWGAKPRQLIKSISKNFRLKKIPEQGYILIVSLLLIKKQPTNKQNPQTPEITTKSTYANADAD